MCVRGLRCCCIDYSFYCLFILLSISSFVTIQPTFVNSAIRFTNSFTELVNEAIWFLKRTFQPSLIRRKRKHGFLSRIDTNNGRKTLNRRRNKGRRYVSA